MDSNRGKRSMHRRPWVWGLVLLTLSILYYGGILYSYGVPVSAGTFGDSFGGLGTIISGFALMGVIITIFLQQDQMKVQDELMSEQNQMIQEQNRQIEKQHHYLVRQEINDTFFKLLEYLKEIKQDLGWTNSEDNTLRKLNEELKKSLESAPDENFVELFEVFYSNHRIDLDKYFRTLRYMLRYLGEHDIAFEEKRVYSNLLRAQISQEEASLIYYNMKHRTSMNDGGFEEHIKKFNLLADHKA